LKTLGEVVVVWLWLRKIKNNCFEDRKDLSKGFEARPSRWLKTLGDVELDK
jgi:hypothetical protein